MRYSVIIFLPASQTVFLDGDFDLDLNPTGEVCIKFDDPFDIPTVITGALIPRTLYATRTFSWDSDAVQLLIHEKMLPNDPAMILDGI